MRVPSLALLLAAVLPGCIFCGPTTYHLSGVAAQHAATGGWDPALVRAAFADAGLQPGPESEFSIAASGGNVSATAYRRESGPHELILSFDASASGARDEVERAADARIAEVETDATRIADAIARGAGWTLSATRWDKGMLHGDC